MGFLFSLAIDGASPSELGSSGYSGAQWDRGANLKDYYSKKEEQEAQAVRFPLLPLSFPILVTILDLIFNQAYRLFTQGRVTLLEKSMWELVQFKNSPLYLSCQGLKKGVDNSASNAHQFDLIFLLINI